MNTRNLLLRRSRPHLSLHARTHTGPEPHRDALARRQGLLDPLLGGAEETTPVRRPDPPRPDPVEMSAPASSPAGETSVRPTLPESTTPGTYMILS
jgi:hypothetical protein